MAVQPSGTKKKPAPPAKPTGKPEPAPDKAIPAKPGSHFVQVGAFSSEANANAAAKSVGGSVAKAGNLWRVRMGPFAGEAEARGALGKAKAKGFRDAVVVRDR